MKPVDSLCCILLVLAILGLSGCDDGVCDSCALYEEPDSDTAQGIPAFGYVRLLATEDGAAPDGAAIDALVVTTAGGAQHHPVAVVAYTMAEDQAYASGQNLCLGAPDAYTAYPYTGTCDSTVQRWTYLGPAGSELVLQLAQPFTLGDVLEVLALGDCAAEPMSAAYAVAVAADPAGPWLDLGAGSGPLSQLALAIPE